MHFSDRKSLVGTFVCDSLEPERILLANRLQQLQLVCTHVSYRLPWFLRFFPVLSPALLVGRVSQGYYVCSGCLFLSIPTTNAVNIIIVMIINDHHQQNISQRYSVGAAWPFSPLPCGGVLHINSYHIFLSFHFFHFFCMSTFLFLYTRILRVQISLLLSFYIFFH